MSIVNSDAEGTTPVEVGVGIVLRGGASGGSASGVGSPDNPQILITKRRSGTPYASYWEFPGGKSEPGETAPACIARELREELGIEIEILTVFPPIIHTYEHATVRVHAATCRLAPHSPSPRALDVEAWEWCSLAELPWEAFLPANVRLVSALVRHLDAGGGGGDGREGGEGPGGAGGG